MVKRHFLVVVVLLASLLMVGCGIPQEDYDAVLAERDSAQTQVASLQSDLVEAESQITTLESNLTEAQSELESTQSELESTGSELESAQSQVQSVRNQLSSAQSQVQAQSQKMKKAKTFAEVISSLFVPVLSGEEFNEVEVFMQWMSSIQAIEDPVVERLFDAVIDSEFGGEELLEFYLYIFETLPEILE